MPQLLDRIPVRGANFLSAHFDKPQRDALAILFLRMHDQGIRNMPGIIHHAKP